MIKISKNKKKKRRAHDYKTVGEIPNRKSEISTSLTNSENESLLSTSLKKISFDNPENVNDPEDDIPSTNPFRASHPNEKDTLNIQLNNKNHIKNGSNFNKTKLIKDDNSLSHINDVVMKKWTPRNIRATIDYFPISIKEKDERFKQIYSLSEKEDTKQRFNLIKEYKDQYLSKLCQNLCQKFSLDCSWSTILLKLTKKVIKHIQVNASSGKKMNILSHIKVKTIPGGSMQDCKYINGYVFAKNRIHRRMPTYVENPRILTLSCDLSFSNQEDGIVSMDRLIRYENSYTSYVVSKLMELQPSIIFSDKSIPHMTREIFASHKVVVFSNMKHKAIKLISKITGSEIIYDIDQLNENSCGYAKSVDISSYSGPWGKKVCTHLKSNSMSNFATIILRGAPIDMLINIKNIFNFVVFSAYNMKLEEEFYNTLPSVPNEESKKMDLFNDDNYLITSSWSVVIPKPKNDLYENSLNPLLRRESTMCELYANVEKVIDGEYHPVYNRKTSISFSYSSFLKIKFENELLKDEKKLVTTNLVENEFEKKLNQSLSPNYIIFLHALLSKTGSLCNLYEWLKIDYYSSNDISLKQFLIDFCCTSTYKCQSCHLPIIDHDRAILHNQAKLHISVIPFKINYIAPQVLSNQQTIYTWAICKDNDKSYPYTKILSREEMNISFGKFLEHYFYSDKIICTNCKGSHFKDHIHYYYFNDKVVCFEYTSLNIYSIETPSNVIDIDHQNDLYLDVLKEELNSIMKLFDTTTCMISLKLNTCLERKDLLDENDIRIALDRYEEDMLSIKKLLSDEEEVIINKRSNIFKINSLRQILYNKVANWNGTVIHYETIINRKLECIKASKIAKLINESIPLKTIEIFNDLSASPSSDSSVIISENEKESNVSNYEQKSSQMITKKSDSVLAILNAQKAYLFTQLNEHVVVVEEDNPASLISFALMSSSYKQKLKEFQLSPLKNLTPEEAALGLISENNTTINIEWRLTPIWGGSKILVQCKSYFAQQFAWLRKFLRVDEIKYAQSLQKCKIYDSSGGKSGAGFTITADQRFIVKSVPSIELIPFLQSAHHYFNYLSKMLLYNVPTSLTKIVGIYSVTFSSKSKSLKKYHLIVQENLFYKSKITKVFDLKGSLSRRYGKNIKEEKKVFLDEDLIESMFIDPICIDRESKSSLSMKVWNDSIFLSSMNIMDYSLLVGVDENNKLIVGIIDYMRTYTWDKQLETWVKKSGILGRNKSNLPTVISPKQYKKRFRSAMWDYFLMIPYIGIHLTSNKKHV